MQNLQVLIDMLTKNRRLHISIVDVSGILSTEKTKIEFKNVIHSKAFCDVAKSTEKGYRLCLYCKMLTNTKAITEKESFAGHCPYGLYEVTMPVILSGATAAIVYVGNAVADIKKTTERIERASAFTSVDAKSLHEKIEESEHIDNSDELFSIAEIICDYIKMLYKTEAKSPTKLHWLVAAIKRQADEEFSRNPTIKELASIYRKNEKYLGRLFEREMGISFHQYCLALKLQKSANLLTETEDKIIDIALECGFNTISYFNRVFKKEYGVSPLDYRLHK